jgi:hypothetical protein
MDVDHNLADGRIKPGTATVGQCRRAFGYLWGAWGECRQGWVKGEEDSGCLRGILLGSFWHIELSSCKG